jgi:hypothetical protein
MTMTMKKLYEIPDGTRVRLCEEPRVPPCAPVLHEGDELTFHHIDGMYSYCTTDTGKVVHVAAWTLVKEVNAKT